MIVPKPRSPTRALVLVVVQEMKVLQVCWHTGTIFGNTEYTLYIYLERLVSMCMRSSTLFKPRNITMYSILIQKRKSYQCACQVSWRSAFSSPTLVRGAFMTSGLSESG